MSTRTDGPASAVGISGDSMSFSGKVAIVTGAGSGIGRASALALAGAGARVAVVDRDEAAAQATVASIEGLDAAVAVRADVSRESEVAAMVASVVERWG